MSESSFLVLCTPVNIKKRIFCGQTISRARGTSLKKKKKKYNKKYKEIKQPVELLKNFTQGVLLIYG